MFILACASKYNRMRRIWRQPMPRASGVPISSRVSRKRSPFTRLADDAKSSCPMRARCTVRQFQQHYSTTRPVSEIIISYCTAVCSALHTSACRRLFVCVCMPIPKLNHWSNQFSHTRIRSFFFSFSARNSFVVLLNFEIKFKSPQSQVSSRLRLAEALA